MLRVLSILSGIVFIFVGVAGYLPLFYIDGLLFGYFHVDGLHNLFHIVTGVIAIIAAASVNGARFFFQLFGIIYAALAVIGFWRNGDLWVMQMNMADNILHITIAVVFLLLGFGFRKN